jgi:hypothetical protein
MAESGQKKKTTPQIKLARLCGCFQVVRPDCPMVPRLAGTVV